MQQVQDRRDPEALQLAQRLVGEAPVVTVRPQVGFVIGQAIAQVAEAEVGHEGEILPPPPIVTALLHLVAANAAVIDPGVGALDTRGEQELAPAPPGPAAPALAQHAAVAIAGSLRDVERAGNV